MKKIIFLLCCYFQFCDAQDRNSIWCFGDSAGIDFTNLSNPLPFSSAMDGRGSSISVADSNGALLFYGDTRSGSGNASTLVYNSQHQVMQNGDLIRGEGWYNELAALPMGGNKYYLFSINIVFAVTEGFYYSIIDMNQNGGLGAVVQKNIQLNNFRNADCVSAIKHGNGRDWWIVSKYSSGSSSFNRFYTYLVTSDSIYSPIMQDLNNASDVDLQKIVFSPDGSKMMQFNTAGFLCEYDFDRCSGIISNPNIIFPEQVSNFDRLFWEGAYSPNGNIFYLATKDIPAFPAMYLLQFDLTAANVPASCDTLDTWFDPEGTGAVRLGPDGKIYSTHVAYWGGLGYPYPDTVRNYINENLGVINSPNNLGVVCDYQPFSFSLGGKRTYYGLPNNPNYSLPPLIASGCDSLFNKMSDEKIIEQKLILSPNPAVKNIYANARGLRGKKATVKIFNVLGELTMTSSEDIFSGGYLTTEFEIEKLQSGIYFISIESEVDRVEGKFIVR